MTRLAALLLLALPLLAGCATGPGFATDDLNTELVPRTASDREDGAAGDRVLWGGRIIHTEPGQDTTRIEVLGYPLQRNQKPDTSASSEGRFLVIHDGYLEPADYRPDRLMTVTGRLKEPMRGRIGEADYRYPVIQADDLHLWPEEPRAVREEPRVRFGIGVMISR